MLLFQQLLIAFIHQRLDSPALLLLLILYDGFMGTMLFLSQSWMLRIEKRKRERIAKQIKDQEKKEEKDEKEEIETIKNELKRKKRTMKVKKALHVLGIMVIACYCLWVGVWLIYPIFLWHNFDLYTTQIKPYITSGEMDSLKSRWTLMRNKKDYDDISDYILKIREENDLNR